MIPPLLARLGDAALEATIVGSFSTIGYRARRRLWGWEPPDRLEGRTVMITGVTTGLGRAAATRLAALGATLHVVGRDESRTSRARDEIVASTGNGDVHVAVADLSDLDAVRALGERFVADHRRLDALLHNAGALLPRYTTSAQGHEVTVATHVLGPFLLTAALLPALRGTPRSRVVTVSSGGMYAERLHVEDLEMTAGAYRGTTAYARAKRAQVVLNGEWARRFPGGPPAFCTMHPGWAATPGVDASLPGFSRIMGPLLRTPDQGADTIVWLAADDTPVGNSGSFWLDRRRRRTDYLPWTRTGSADAARLWNQVVAVTAAAPLLSRPR